LRLDLGQRLAAEVPAEELHLGDEHRLSETALLPELLDLSADDVARTLHVLSSESDATLERRLYGSEFRTEGGGRSGRRGNFRLDGLA
jgi:hypothetical protein